MNRKMSSTPMEDFLRGVEASARNSGSVPAVVDWDGTIYHRGREITEDELNELQAQRGADSRGSDGIIAIDFRPPNA